eukprot:11151064-Alexandrium_andersonii.AAC.1
MFEEFAVPASPPGRTLSAARNRRKHRRPYDARPGTPGAPREPRPWPIRRRKQQEAARQCFL